MYDQTAHRHDGFYLSFGGGPGGAFDSVSIAGADSGDLFAVAGQFAIEIGGTITKGIVVGFGLYGTYSAAGREDLAISEANDEGKASYFLGGILAEYYPDSRSGLHFRGAAGLGVAQFDISTEELNETDNDELPGLGITASIGYDFWIGEQWSFGPEGRLSD